MIALLVLLGYLQKLIKNPLISAGIYSVANISFILLFVHINGVHIGELFILAFLSSAIYFWLLDKVEDSLVTWFVILIIGAFLVTRV